MAYDKHTWTCDEPITVERLNHIEDGIAAGGDCDCGFECEEEWVTLTEESMTTEDFGGVSPECDFTYSDPITADTIKVTFNGTVYTVPASIDETPKGTIYGYGATSTGDGYDFATYPFHIKSNANGLNIVYTETAGTYTVKIEVAEEIITTTPCFDKARGYSCEEEQILVEESVTTEDNGDFAVGELSCSQLIDADTITVTFNGTEYECPRISMDGGFIYGGFAGNAPDFSQYPFTVASSSTYGNGFYTETAGTYTIKIEGTKETITTTPCFEKAVKSVGGDVVYAKIERTVDEDGCYIYTLNITDADLAQIISKGQQLVILEPTSKSGSGNYVMYYPTLVWADGVSPATEVSRVIDIGGLGDPVAMVTITIMDHFTLNEHLLTLFAYSGTASPRYLEGRTCVSQDPLIVPLSKDISAATTSSPVESTVEAYYEIANALENGVSVYLQEGSSKTNLLVTAYNAGSGMSDATITVNVETYNSTLNVTYSMPATFYFDQDGYCYYPPSGSST